MRKVKAFLQRLGGAWKLLTAALIGILSLAANAWLVLTVKNWSGQHWYNPTQEIITSGAATAAILITIFIYSPEVVKVLAETFLNKRFQAGHEIGKAEGRTEGEEIGEARGVQIGEARGEARTKAEILKLLEEHPELTLEQVKEYLHNGSDNGHSGKSE